MYQVRLCLVMLIACIMPLALEAQDSPVHDEIREMRDGAIGAFLARDKDGLLSYFADDVIFTAMNNEVVRGVDAADDYYDRMLTGSNSLVENLEMTFAVDELTNLYLDDRTGVAAGDMTTDFKMRGGLEFSVPLRWTAALIRQDDGWKVSALHFSANMFDNPLDNSLRSYLWLMLGAAAVLGLLVGWIIGRRSAR